MAESVEAIDPIKKKKDEAAAAQLASDYAQALAIRQNSVLKDDTAPPPTDAVIPTGRTSAAARSIALANKLRQVAAQETAAGKAIEKQGNDQKASVAKAQAADQVKADQERDMARSREHEVAAQQQRAQEFRKQQDGASAGFGNSQEREEAAAFLKAKGHELLNEAADDPVKIQQALDLLAESGIESERAAQLYQDTYSMASTLGSEAALAELTSQQEGAYAAGATADANAASATLAHDIASGREAQATVDQGQNMQFEAWVMANQAGARADAMLADEMPWNITPVKT